ncbi:MAG: molybdopterin-dependent oxidoreductase [Alphaproteobacteria bacterium]
MTELTTANHWGSYRATVENGRVTDLKPLVDGDEMSVMTQSMIDTLDGPSRIRKPAIRKSWLEGGPGTAGDMRGADEFVEVEWDRALDLLTDEIQRIRTEFGNEAIYAGSYGWGSAGRFHHPQSQLHRFYNMAGGYVRSVNAYSFAAAEVILPHVICPLSKTMSDSPSWYEIAEHTDTVLAFGGWPVKNAQIQNGIVGVHTIGDWMRRLGTGKGRFIGISPLKDDMPAVLGADWVPVRPNSDIALMLALAHDLEVSGHADHAFIEKYCVGYEPFRRYLLGQDDGQPKNADWAAPITGISADRISDLAKLLRSGRILISLSWSLQRADRGEQVYWMGVILAAMIGQIGLPGGGIAIGLAAEHGQGNPDPQVKWAAVPQGQNPVESFIPVARISDMLLNPGAEFDYNGRRMTYPDIKLVHWAGGNPFHHHQDLNRLRRAWAKPDTIVVNEIFWNALARHADIVLPATTPMERNDIAAAQLDGWVVANKQLVQPVGLARNDHDIFADAAERLGFRDRFTEGRSERDWLRDLWDRSRQQAGRSGIELPGFDEFWDMGHLHLPGGPQIRCFLGDFREDPRENRLRTPSGRIEISSETIARFGYADIGAFPTWQAPYEWLGNVDGGEDYPLHLISNQPRTRLHSQLDPGAGSTGSKIQGREPMRMNPADAAERGIADSSVVRVFNDRGAILAGVTLDDAVMPGVLQLATGAWYDPDDPSAPASIDRHGNPNVLTADRGTGTLAQGPSAHTCLVEVAPFDGAVPAVRAFESPVASAAAE